jgi:hypothetical protein
MSPVVEAAWIAAGTGILSLAGTVTVAISGFRNTRKVTTLTIQAGTDNTVRTLDAVRDERLWDKRTVTYEEVVTHLLHLQVKRRHQMRIYQLDERSVRLSDGLFGAYDAPDWWGLRGRLGVYGSDKVIEAYEVSNAAEVQFNGLYARLCSLSDDSKQAVAAHNPAGVVDPNELRTARQAAHDARKEAEEKNQALIKLIRRELHAKPSQVDAHTQGDGRA